MIIGCTVGLAALVGVVAWWSSAPSSPGSAPGQLAAASAQLSGLVASVFVCLQLLLMLQGALAGQCHRTGVDGGGTARSAVPC